MSGELECGYSKPLQSIELSRKDEIVKTLWLHYVYFSPHAELEQLKKGFRETLQMESLICRHPLLVIGFLIASSDVDVTSNYMLDSFVNSYSDQGSNK